MKKIISTILAILLLSLPCWGSLLFTEGSSEYINILDAASLSALSPLSISFWFKDNGDTYGYPVTKFASGQAEWVIYFNKNTTVLEFKVYDVSQSNAKIGRDDTNSAIWDGSEHHIVCVWDGGTTDAAIKIYTDGVQVDDTGIGTGTFLGIEDRTSPVQIGHNLGSANHYIDGYMWDARIYNLELGLTQANNIYYSHGNDNIVGSAGWWRMDEKPAGQTAGAGDVVDLSGNGNTGDGTNTPVYAAEPVTIIKPIQGD